MYFHGLLGVVKSSKKAAKIYKRAVELGNVDAMVNLGCMYANGDGVKLDNKKATQLYRMAAVRGHAIAQKNLAQHLLRDGKREEGFKLLRLAAEQGLTLAETLVGACFVKGDGVPANLEEARRWLGRAAAKGDQNATRLLQRLDRGGNLA